VDVDDARHTGLRLPLQLAQDRAPLRSG
jgi:hypothetical protein